jgi:ferredoxin-type protein NapG
MPDDASGVKQSTDPKGLPRRAFISGAVGAGVLIALGGIAKVAVAQEPLLRPPGGQNEAAFIGNCIKCDRCRSACPNNAIGVSNIADGLLDARSPKMDFRKGYCDFCANAGGGSSEQGDTGLLCELNCPTGALGLFNHNTQRIGLAVVDPEQCIAFARLGGCKVCVEKCLYQAITFDTAMRPVVHTDLCNGCGYCEYICPSGSYRSFTGSVNRGINIEPAGGQRP